MEVFFKLASPTTLASLIVDIDQVEDLTTALLELRHDCTAALVANVGDSEAIELIEAVGYCKTLFSDAQSRCDAAALVPLDCCAIVVEVAR